MSEKDREEKGFTVVDRRGSANEDAPSGPASPEHTHQPDARSRPDGPKVDFAMLAQSIAISALHYMGLVADPASDRPERDLPLARHNIEILELLEEKTRGNLSPEESQLLASLLYEVRMHFVEATKSAP
jgi:hypothetical protein